MSIPKKQFYFFSFIILIFFTGCASLSSFNNSIDEAYYSKTPQWQPLIPEQQGFSQTSYIISKRKVTWHCIKIDLDTPDLDFYSYPSTENLGKTYKVKNLSKKHNAVVAINTTPFDLDGKTYLPVGIIQYKNQQIYSPAENYCMLVLSKDKNTSTLRANIISSQTDNLQTDDKEISAYGGFYVILENGNIKSFNQSRRSRIGVGISDNGRFLYILAASPDFHPTDRNGLTYEECAQIFKNLGCTDAMQFDGGHSSALVVNGKDTVKPFMQRKVPTVLLFFKQD